jgi:hypothetical protein
VIKDVEGHGLIWGTILAFVWREWATKTSVRIVGASAGIRTGHLPHTSQTPILTIWWTVQL